MREFTSGEEALGTVLGTRQAQGQGINVLVPENRANVPGTRWAAKRASMTSKPQYEAAPTSTQEVFFKNFLLLSVANSDSKGIMLGG